MDCVELNTLTRLSRWACKIICWFHHKGAHLRKFIYPVFRIIIQIQVHRHMCLHATCVWHAMHQAIQQTKLSQIIAYIFSITFRMYECKNNIFFVALYKLNMKIFQFQVSLLSHLSNNVVLRSTDINFFLVSCNIVSMYWLVYTFYPLKIT